MACLDIGCGGGDVSFDLARLVGPGGTVLAVDVDDVKIEIARAEAAAQQIQNIEFRVADLEVSDLAAGFDLAHARFVLSHLQNPERMLAELRKALRPGGVVAIVDTDFRGHFSEPDCPSLRRYVDLYIETVRRRGGDANIGLRLPALLARTGLDDVQMSVVQHAATEGETKLIVPMTMEFVADAIVAEGLASQAEVDEILADLYEFARDPNTVLSGPRIIQTCARKPTT
jgi:ubiquinone/menaquinone biosynthesis C-methylase UbiE